MTIALAVGTGILMIVIQKTTCRPEGLNGDTPPQEPRGAHPAHIPSVWTERPGRIGNLPLCGVRV